MSDISMIWGVDQAEIAKIVHSYLERGISCEYDRLNCPPPPIYIGPVKIKTFRERLEEMQMKATSVQNIKNVKNVTFTIENFPMEMNSTLTVIATTNDDIFEFEFEGPDLLKICKAAGLFTGWEKDQKIKELEKELGDWKKEAADCLKLRDEARKENHDLNHKYERAMMEKQQIKKEYEENARNLEKEIKKLKEECHSLESMRKHKEEHKVEPTSVWKIENIDKIWITQDDDEISLLLKNRDDLCKIILTGDAIKNHNNQFVTTLKADIDEGLRKKDQEIREKNKEINKLKQQLHQVENDKKRLTYRYKTLENEYNLEKAANEAQHKFIREYAGKGTEIKFNYAIDDVKEVSYVIVDKEKYNKNFEKWLNAQSEQDSHTNTRSDILDQAKKCVCGHREQDYGTPESNFQLIADLWNGYLFPSLKENKAVISAKDVAMLMALMKIARIRNGGGSGDSFVDLAGYAACGGEIWAKEKKQKDQN